MKPSELQKLIGKVLVPAMPLRGPQTIRFKVLGFGAHDVRFRTVHNGHASSAPIDEVERDILSGLLRVEDK